MGKSKIEWTEKTWNPVTGCTKISEGCQNCYAERMSKRLAGRCGYDHDKPFKVTLHPERMEEPLKWKKASKIFVCSMGDLFHDEVPFEFIARVFARMQNTRQHTFIVLTKRPERMAEFIMRTGHKDAWLREFPHIWLGVTAENQKRADERIPILLNIPAAVRFVSVEPMLEPVYLDKDGYSLLTCHQNCNEETEAVCLSYENSDKCFHGIDWVICGGESGPGARPMHPDWVRSLRNQCTAANVPFFFKQWGEWTSVYPQGLSLAHRKMSYQHNQTFYRVGKKNAGRELDGQIWDQYPEVEA